MNRAYSTIELKAVDESQRILEGIASTPETDRVGDIVESLGAKFKIPLPFLWQHRHDQPIGHVISANVAADGIRIRVQIAKDDEPGPLKNLLDMAWRSIQKGLVRGLSIGFRSLGDPEPIKGTYGLRFKEWEMLEVSSVTIPANAGAGITSIRSIKSIDADLLAALGQEQKGAKLKNLPGASGAPVKLIHPTKSREDSMNIAEKLKEYEGTRGTKQARILELMELSAKEDRTLDAAEAEEHDTLEGDIGKLNEHIKRLQSAQALTVAQAKPVDPTPTIKAAGEVRSTVVTVEREEKLAPGLQFARFAMCVAAAKGNTSEALQLLQAHYPKHPGIEVVKAAASYGRTVEKHISMLGELRTKTDIAAGTTADATWASPLVAYNQFAGDFVEFLRPATIVGKFGTGNIPSLRRVPFNVHIRGQTTGGTGYWVGQGKPKPVTKFDFNDVYHGWYKVAAISVITEDLIRFSDPSAEMLVRDALRDALVEVIDETFIDPATGAVANVSPASITNGATAIASSGDTADAIRADLLDLWAESIAANLPLTSAVYITTPAIALALSLLRNDLGQKEFPDVGMMGGTLEGVPLIVSNYVPSGTVVLAFASEIWFSDDGVVTVDASREASIQMMDNPTNASDVPTHTSMVSMFQTNSIALRGERFINWSKRRDEAVTYLFAVSWGGAES